MKKEHFEQTHLKVIEISWLYTYLSFKYASNKSKHIDKIFGMQK